MHSAGVYAAYLALFGGVLTIVAWATLARCGRRVTNFQGRSVLAGYGVFILAWAAAGAAAATVSGLLSLRVGLAELQMILTFGILGLVDDLFGAHGGGGFLGHFRELILRRKVTTGVAKAVGGGASALAAACIVWPGAPVWQTTQDAALIALSANFINLLDLRPGRAGWSFLGLAVLEGAGRPSGGHWLACIPAAAAALCLLPRDARGEWIMGDVGSNVLGAILGMGVVLLFPVPVRIAALAVLVAVHVFAERRSISKTIESSRILSAIDRRLGVR